MRILHLSDGGLPDWRIEKSALTASKLGYQVYFAGARKSSNYEREIFSKIYEITWSPGSGIGRWIPNAKVGNFIHWRIIKKQIQKILTELRPDVVHAHNLFAARMMLELKNIPFIYDAHENWSTLVKRQKEKTSPEILLRLIRKGKIREAGSGLFTPIRSYLWTKWETEIVASVPVLTPSITGASQYQSISKSNKIFVIPNYPIIQEVANCQMPTQHDKLTCAYVGGDKAGQRIPHRNVDGFTNLFEFNNIGELHIIGSNEKSTDKVKYHGFLPRESLFEELSNHSVGLIPFQKHWSHSTINPNKAFEYAHAGLFLMHTSSMTELTRIFGDNCQTFEDYPHLASILAYFKDNRDDLYNKRLKIFQFARSKLLWEKNEHNIIEAYRIC